MITLNWIALGVWVIAACHPSDRLPTRQAWGWITAKALALKSWVTK